MKHRKLIASILSIILLLGACQRTPQPLESSSSPLTTASTTESQVSTTITNTEEPSAERFTTTFLELFDTMTQVIAYAESQEAFDDAMVDLKNDLEHYHQLYDTFQSYEGVVNLRTVNEQAGKGPVKVSQEIIDLLLYSKEMYHVTQGQVNIALGAVLEIWHEVREASLADPNNAHLPDMAELKKAAKHANLEDVIIDEDALTVELKDPEMRIDVGAIAKGYATEQVAKRAEARGVTYMLLSVGGNVRAVGSRGNAADPWRVSIRNPFDESLEEKPFVTILNLEDASLVTSGVYERYFMYEGKRYHHIINPETLMPENQFMSVSVVTADSGLADALSTAIFNLDIADGQALIESLEGTEALWIYQDGTEVASSGFRALEYKKQD